jgi:glutamyl-Q tRNA(Asp) synthetase
MAFVTRFAPSPTGPLHLGHAYSAMLAHDMARAEGGTFLLRIEDIDRTRSKPEWERQLLDDLHWLGVWWDADPMRQSDRLPAYAQALDSLWNEGLIYPCLCKRSDIAAALSAPQEGAAPTVGPDGLIYPGTCRGLMSLEQQCIPETYPRPEAETLRLDIALAVNRTGGFIPRIDKPNGDRDAHMGYDETGIGPSGRRGRIEFTQEELVHTVGDIVVARRDMGTSYHLSVVVDDAAHGITHVIRGADLTEATKIHVFLQHLLQLPTPIYHHHRLIRDDQGRRLAKRDDARALSKYRAEGATPADIRRLVGLAG